MKKKIWFNRWFSTVTHYIDMIRQNPDQRQFTIYGTHPNLDAVYLRNCDVSFIEPDMYGQDYVEFCLNFCLEHKIDLFIPRKGNVEIARQINEFEHIGTKVLVSPSNLMVMMDNKVEMYRSLEKKIVDGKSIVAVPEYAVVNNVEQFVAAVSTLEQKGFTPCIKPVIGEGANGFRIIDDSVDTVNSLFNTPFSSRISYEHLKRILETQNTFEDLIVLEYLDGIEYSIDCLAYNEILYAAVPRKKGNGRVRELEKNEELLEIAQKVTQEYNIPYIFNIQVRYGNGIPKLLEINPRMSGGLHISCLSGVNFPYLAVKLLLGEEIEIELPRFDIRATHIEQSVLLS